MKKVWFEDHSLPKCFDSREQFKDWHQAMMQAKTGLYNCWVCTDCLPGFQKKMIKQGRCENPHVKFKKEYESAYGTPREDEWFIVGYVEDADFQKEVERRERESKVIWAKYLRY